MTTGMDTMIGRFIRSLIENLQGKLFFEIQASGSIEMCGSRNNSDRLYRKNKAKPPDVGGLFLIRDFNLLYFIFVVGGDRFGSC